MLRRILKADIITCCSNTANKKRAQDGEYIKYLSKFVEKKDKKYGSGKQWNEKDLPKEGENGDETKMKWNHTKWWHSREILHFYCLTLT